MSIDDEIDFNNFSTWNLNTFFKFIKENVIQILLLILVFIIIYIVDYISNINAMLFASHIPQNPNKKRNFKK